jgi:hypothetical protein
MKSFPASGETSKMILSLKIFPALLAATLFIPVMAAGLRRFPAH